MATTADYLNKLVTQKNTLADNLTTKGVTATHDETLETLVPKVLQISGGEQGNNGIYPIGKDGRPTGDVIVPEGVTSLYRYIFDSNTAVTSVTLPTTLTSLNDYTFHNCTSLTSVKLNDNIATISTYSFAYTAITNFSMPQTLTNIGSHAFSWCKSLQIITFKKNNDIEYINIDGYAFGTCSALTTVDFETDDILIYPSYYGFYNCTNLGNDAVMKIIDHLYTGSVATERCFYNCTGITDITISKSGKRMFSNCSNLNHCKILESETCIYAGLFENCKNLTSVEIPATITKDTDNALTTSITSNNYFLYGCNNLESITVGEGWNMSMRLDVTANLTVDSMVGIFNNIKDLTGETAKVLTLGSANILKLTDEQRAIAINKNWTLA